MRSLTFQSESSGALHVLERAVASESVAFPLLNSVHLPLQDNMSVLFDSAWFDLGSLLANLSDRCQSLTLTLDEPFYAVSDHIIEHVWPLFLEPSDLSSLPVPRYLKLYEPRLFLQRAILPIVITPSLKSLSLAFAQAFRRIRTSDLLQDLERALRSSGSSVRHLELEMPFCYDDNVDATEDDNAAAEIASLLRNLPQLRSLTCKTADPLAPSLVDALPATLESLDFTRRRFDHSDASGEETWRAIYDWLAAHHISVSYLGVHIAGEQSWQASLVAHEGLRQLLGDVGRICKQRHII